MKSKILLLAVTVAALSSCTTSYKTGQTPDDVYYSPARPEEEYVQRDKKDDRNYSNNEDSYYEDQYLRMKVRNRYRWSDLDDPYYYSSRYNYSTYNCNCFSNPWTPSTYWNNQYNPYYHGSVIISPQTTTRYTGPRTFNLNSYNNTVLTNGSYSNPKYSGSGSGTSNNNNNSNNTYNAPRNSSSNNGNNSGNILRDIFGGSSNNNSHNTSGNSSNTNSSSTSTPSSSSSSSGSSGSSAPVRKF